MTTIFPPTLESLTADGAFLALKDLQAFCYGSARSKGFHDADDALKQRQNVAGLEGDASLEKILDAATLDRMGNRLMLIVGEAVEAHEEIRNGNDPRKRYYSYNGEISTERERDGVLGKPEGFPSEIADILIRVLDLSGEAKIDLADVVMEKLAFNASREKMHGRKF